MEDEIVIKALLHLTVMDNLVKQINKKKINILKNIYKDYFKGECDMTYAQFQNSIFKKNRVD
jgi:hypothetical protein